MPVWSDSHGDNRVSHDDCAAVPLLHCRIDLVRLAAGSWLIVWLLHCVCLPLTAHPNWVRIVTAMLHL